MASIWDPPGMTTRPAHGSDVQSHLQTAAEGGGFRQLWLNGLYGVYNGEPMGLLQRARESNLAMRYSLRPTWLGRLRAATRSAIGR